LRGTSVSAAGLARLRSFHWGFLTIAVLLIGDGDFFCVFGGFGNCIYVLHFVWVRCKLGERLGYGGANGYFCEANKRALGCGRAVAKRCDDD
jgi:hypothetical protein